MIPRVKYFLAIFGGSKWPISENEGQNRQLGEMTRNRGDIEAAHQLSNEMLDASNELVKEMEEIDNQKYLSDA